MDALSVHCVQAHLKHAHAAARDPRLLATVSPSIVASRSQTLPASWSDLGEHHTPVPLVVKSLRCAAKSSNTRFAFYLAMSGSAYASVTDWYIVMFSVVSSLQRLSFWALASVYDTQTVHVPKCPQHTKMLGVCLS